MNKFIMTLLLSLMLNFLQANDTIFTSPKIALKMIDKEEIIFISLIDASLNIKKSKSLNIKTLKSLDVLGRMGCSPFYVCSKEIEEYFSSLGIDNSQVLVIYDDVYGINAATLYATLESMGHEKITILRGSVNDIAQLDPNWKIYRKYLDEASKNIDAERRKKIRQKINLLKPYLLVEDSNDSNIEDIKSNYKVTHKNIEYLLSREELREAISKVRTKESNMTIIDACEMIDIVKKDSSPYMAGIKSLSWKKLIDKKQKHLKSNKELEKIFMELALNKNDTNYIYCMSGAQKAFYMMMALRELGYSKVKVFTGDWNTWIGDINE